MSCWLVSFKLRMSMFPSLYRPLLVVMTWILTRTFLTNLDTPHHLMTPSPFPIVPPPSPPHDLLSPPAAAAAAVELKKQILVLQELTNIPCLLEHVRKKHSKSRKLSSEQGLGIKLKHSSQGRLSLWSSLNRTVPRWISAEYLLEYLDEAAIATNYKRSMESWIGCTPRDISARFQSF